MDEFAPQDFMLLVAQGLRSLLQEARAQTALLRALRRNSDLQLGLTSVSARMLFGKGPVQVEEKVLNTTAATQLFQNRLSRAVIAIVRVVTVGDGSATVAPAANGSGDVGLRLDLSILGDETPALLVMPNESLWATAQVGGTGRLIVEAQDVSAWAGALVES